MIDCIDKTWSKKLEKTKYVEYLLKPAQKINKSNDRYRC